MVVSMTHPHDPYVVPEEYWNRYRDADIDPPRVPDLAGLDDPHSQRLRHVIGLGTVRPSEGQVQAARRAYYAAVSYVDDQVGALMRALREAQFEDRTVVVLLADHGDMLGERGLWYKMNFFEPACRIPLILSAPWRFSPRRVSETASLVDLLPTFVALAREDGIPSYAAPLDGANILPALEGGKTRDEAVGEYLAEGAIAPIVMIRRSRHKFVHSPVDPDQLYDLAADPDERANLAAGSAQKDAIGIFRNEVSRRWNLTAVHQAVLASQQRRHLVYAALREGQYRAWDFQPIRDASRTYIRNDRELNDLERMARFPPLA